MASKIPKEALWFMDSQQNYVFYEFTGKDRYARSGVWGFWYACCGFSFQIFLGKPALKTLMPLNKKSAKLLKKLKKGK